MIKTAWAVYSQNDDGRPTKRLSIHSTEGGAKIAAKGKGSWGTDGYVEQCYVIEHDGRCYLLSERDPVSVSTRHEDDENARSAALAKLTPDERAALGYS